MISKMLLYNNFPVIVSMYNKKPIIRTPIIVFDLDNTLISSIKVKNYNQHNNMNIRPCDYTTNIPNRCDDEQYNVWKRPYSSVALYFLSKVANVYIYTAATEDYAKDIITNIYPNFKPKNIYHRDHWIAYNKSKDLSIINNKNDDIILVDDKLFNNIKSQRFYHIPQYHYHNKGDTEMLRLVVWMYFKFIL
jgi:TFIIF-interacting CTD phosphatase-like protein